MATSDALKVPRFIRSTITLPCEELRCALDAERTVQLASMEVDGLDPSGLHLPASGFVDIWMETMGPYKVREVKDLELVSKSGLVTIPQLERIKAWRAAAETAMVLSGTEKETMTPPNPTASPESENCEKKRCTSPVLLDQNCDCPFQQPREIRDHENLGSMSCGRHLKKTLACRTTFRSKSSLSTASSGCADISANISGFEMVEEEDAFAEEAIAVFCLDHGNGVEEGYVDVQKR